VFEHSLARITHSLKLINPKAQKKNQGQLTSVKDTYSNKGSNKIQIFQIKAQGRNPKPLSKISRQQTSPSTYLFKKIILFNCQRTKRGKDFDSAKSPSDGSFTISWNRLSSITESALLTQLQALARREGSYMEPPQSCQQPKPQKSGQK
jgi:hypothetical protein